MRDAMRPSGSLRSNDGFALGGVMNAAQCFQKGELNE